jgi:hypothetical protein
MSQKNIEFKSHKKSPKALSNDDEKKISSSQHSRIKKSMANQLRGEIDTLLLKQKKARAETRKSYEENKKWEALGI